jgi:hypothetical protein
MDGREWIIPALSLRQFRQYYKMLLDTNVTAETFQEYLMERLPVVLGAIQRNYPELTEEQLLDMVDLRTFVSIVKAIGTVSGMHAATPGE